MDIKADSGTAEYYLHRLVQRALIEAKPLLRIYEEECQRHPDISVTVTFKEFQTALQKHYGSMHTQQQQAVVNHLKQQEANNYHKDYNARFTSLGDFVDNRKRRRTDLQSNNYQRAQQSVLGRFSPQGNHSNNRFNRNDGAVARVNIKTEVGAYTSPAQAPPPAQPTHTASRPPSTQPPVEEEPPPEFIEMSSNPPRMTGNNQFASLYQGNEQSGLPSGNVTCKAEPKESDSGGTVDGTVQSSSPFNKNTLLGSEDISPLNVRCVKCITARVTCAIMPCGHCCLCNICGQTALSLKQVCPVCRKSISTVIGYTNLIYNVYR